MVALSPRLAQVLACLADARGELVTRELLMDRFWPDVNGHRQHAHARRHRHPQGPRRRPGTSCLRPDDGPPWLPVRRRRSRVEGDLPVGARNASGTASLSAGLEPFVAWERGRAASRVAQRRRRCPAPSTRSRSAVAGAPQYAPGPRRPGQCASLPARSHARRQPARHRGARPPPSPRQPACNRARSVDGRGLGRARPRAGRRRPGRRGARGRSVTRWPRSNLATGGTTTAWRVTSWGEERFQRGRARRRRCCPASLRITRCRRWCSSPGSRSPSPPRWRRAAPAAAGGPAGRACDLYPATGLLWVRGLTALGLGRTDAASLADFLAEAEHPRPAGGRSFRLRQGFGGSP